MKTNNAKTLQELREELESKILDQIKFIENGEDFNAKTFSRPIKQALEAIKLELKDISKETDYTLDENLFENISYMKDGEELNEETINRPLKEAVIKIETALYYITRTYSKKLGIPYSFRMGKIYDSINWSKDGENVDLSELKRPILDMVSAVEAELYICQELYK